MSVFELKDFSLFTASGNVLLKDVNLKMHKGEALHLVGENGVGKSTLILSILNKHQAYAGELTRSFNSYSYLAQLSNKNPKLPIALRDVSSVEYPFYPKSMFDIALQTASGGERKKAMLSRVFAENSDFMILDEPFNHLDQKSIVLVKEYLDNYIKSGRSLLITGHTDLGHRKEDLSKWTC